MRSTGRIGYLITLLCFAAPVSGSWGYFLSRDVKEQTTESHQSLNEKIVALSERVRLLEGETSLLHKIIKEQLRPQLSYLEEDVAGLQNRGQRHGRHRGRPVTL